MTVDRETVSIDARPEVVWDLVSDITRMGEWSPECTGGRWFGRRKAPEVGASFVGYNRRGWIRWLTTAKVEESERGRSFVFRIRESGVRWGYEFEPDGDGTRLSEFRDLSGARVGMIRTFSSLFLGGMDDHAEELREGMRQTLAGIKAAAEP
jgi:hypothetical protein